MTTIIKKYLIFIENMLVLYEFSYDDLIGGGDHHSKLFLNHP